MADKGAPSEFGGKIQDNNVQPAPHVPTASERLMLLYRTGDVDPSKMPDGGEAFAGLVPYDVQLRRRTAEGVMEKGQVWKELQEAAGPELAALAQEIPDPE